MKLDDGSEFLVIGENVHTTRVVSRKGERVTTSPEGLDALCYEGPQGEPRCLVIPEEVKQTQDYQEGRIKHVKIAVRAAMSGREPDAGEGTQYVRRLVEDQVEAGADFIDLNVDEISLRPEEQKAAMEWLVRAVQGMCDVPLSIDSSNVETLRAGLEACDGRAGRPLLNSASAERLDALDLARDRGARVIVTAAGPRGMPGDDAERADNATRMVEAALSKGIALHDVFIDPLVFPISVDHESGVHCFRAIHRLRERIGPEVQITGGFSNVSFGLPCRRLVNDVFLALALKAGADSGILNPVACNVRQALSMDREARPYRLAEDMLLGRDPHCMNFVRAYRKGELTRPT